ncbi:GAF and ANTAR domain-containing protein [Mycolicibacterium sp. 050158]|uniref:GAF and ANTAR domain-containing protein n=1 Tax=Mycolicibacterium sp. 050158 TaxID=3090602 RepID=UPI00299DE20F|nr:GAF and ANTAR domain-containing protein [Mycolicibacterium sp. 050158]MDX1893417.1 GAF and ANTAR domain-containing protein [Mycolicibacterium sp. 050158]
MSLLTQMRTALGGLCGIDAADLICQTCVALLDVPAAAISLVCDGANVATLGASGDLARTLDEVHFTVGEGPGLDATVAHGSPMVVQDFADSHERRWPIYGQVMLDHHIRGVIALPVAIGGRSYGALELFLTTPQRMHGQRWAAAVLAADLAGALLLDLFEEDTRHAADHAHDEPAWAGPHTAVRAEVAQATGMVMAQLDISPAEALLRLRAHAYATGIPATEVAQAVVDRRLHLEPH